MQHDTKYTILFAIAVCLVCSVFVASSHVLLSDRQQRNLVLDRQTKVLDVAGLLEEGKKLTPAEVDTIFKKRIRPEVIELATGQPTTEIDAVTYDQRSAAKDPALSEKIEANPAKVLRLPRYALIYKVVENDQVTSLILPVEGKGLWSTMYGYLALAPDTRTIDGIIFYEQGETPGLGGEVENPRWRSLWKGRQAFDENWKVDIRVKKGLAGPPSEDPHNVDGLSGATLTSRGVTNLLNFWLSDKGFGPYLRNLRNNPEGGVL